MHNTGRTRLTAILLALLMATSIFSSCSDTTNTESQPSVGAETQSVESVADDETVIRDDLPATMDFGDYDFRVLSGIFYDKELATYLFTEEYTGVPVDDALFEAKTKIEERFKVNMSIIPAGTYDNAADSAIKSINAGDDAFDIHIGHDHRTIQLGKDGLLRNMFDISEFNFDKPWWPKGVVDSLTVSNRMYIASNYMSYCGLHWTRAIAVNKDWAEDLNMTIPYDMVREGKWTLDMLNKLTEDVSYDYDGNGKMTEKDKVGFTSGGQVWYCLQEGVDLPIYRRDSSGEIYVDIDIDRTDKFLQVMRELTNKERFVSSGDFGTQMFEKGNALFAYTQVGDVYDFIRISDIRYGFLPTPKLDELQANYINGCTDVPWCIPKTVAADSQQEHIIGTVCEGLSCYNYNNVIPAYFEVAMKARAADAPDDAEMLQIISDTRVLGFAYAYEMQMNNILGDILSSNQEAASYYKSKEKAATKALERMLDKYSSMD